MIYTAGAYAILVVDDHYGRVYSYARRPEGQEIGAVYIEDYRLKFRTLTGELYELADCHKLTECIYHILKWLNKQGVQ